jgi:hypothetical protein
MCAPHHPIAEPARSVDDGFTAHRAADEREPRHADVVDHGENILAERREAPVVATRP